MNVVKFEIDKQYEIKFLNKSHLDQLLCLQEIIVKNLSDPTSYYVEPIQFFRKQLAIENTSIGFFQNDQLVAFNLASFPSIDEENLGIDIGLKPEFFLQFAQLGPGAVHPDHRKRGLLSKIAEEHPKIMEEMGYRYLCFTASPTNYPTIKAFMDNGFLIKQLKLKFNNVFRYIFYRDLKKIFKPPQYSVRIPNTDIESQKFMMNLGFYGYDVVKNDHGFDLIFGYDEIKA
jgi:ribosomal protein S18 acetylase RimI-like enzyme